MFYIILATRSPNPDSPPRWQKHNVASGISSPDGLLTDEVRENLKSLVRMLYCIIESSTTPNPLTPSEIISRFKLAMKGDPTMAQVISRANTDFLLRADLVTLGHELKADFRLVSSSSVPISTRSYASLLRSLEKFLGHNPLPIILSDYDREFVAAYSRWLEGRGVARSTRFFYLRTLRSLLGHMASESGVELPPGLFEGLRINTPIPAPANPPIPLTREQIRQIALLRFPPGHDETELVRDMFLFSFYCHGLELTEVLNLKTSNIIDGHLRFRRRLKGAPRDIPLDPAALRILARYAPSASLPPGSASSSSAPVSASPVSDTGSASDYLFPLLPRYRGLRYYSISDRVRKSIKQIGQDIGCPRLTFGSNIHAYRHLLASLPPSTLLTLHSD